jgi:hypothetical protein
VLRPAIRAGSCGANISGTDVFVDYTLVYGEATEGSHKGFRCGFAAICWIVICHVEKHSLGNGRDQVPRYRQDQADCGERSSG